MITDDLFIYLLFQLLLIVINIVGYTRVPLLMIIGLIGTILLTPDTIEAFEDYYLMAILLILVNVSFSVMGLSKRMSK